MRAKVTRLFVVISLMAVFMTACQKEAVEKIIFKSLIPPEEVSDMVVYGEYLYTGGLEGLFVLDYEEALVAQHFDDFSTVKDLLVHEELLYIAHDSGLTTYDGDTFVCLTDGEDVIEDRRINAVLIDSIGQLWIGTYMGVYVYDGDVWRSIDSDGPLLHNTIFSLYEDSTGGIWVGHYASPKGGISYLYEDEWTYFTVDQGLPHNNITGFHEDNGLVYAGTGFYSEGGVGIFRLTEGGPVAQEGLVKDWGENGSKVRSVNVLDEVLYLGTEYDGLYIIDGENERLYTTSSGLCHDEIKSIVFIEDMIWLGTRCGVSYGRVVDVVGE